VTPRDPHDAEMVWRSPMMRVSHVLMPPPLYSGSGAPGVCSCGEPGCYRFRFRQAPNYPVDEDMA
jgi:hypothetical protein